MCRSPVWKCSHIYLTHWRFTKSWEQQPTSVPCSVSLTSDLHSFKQQHQSKRSVNPPWGRLAVRVFNTSQRYVCISTEAGKHRAIKHLYGHTMFTDKCHYGWLLFNEMLRPESTLHSKKRRSPSVRLTNQSWQPVRSREQWLDITNYNSFRRAAAIKWNEPLFFIKLFCHICRLLCSVIIHILHSLSQTGENCLPVLTDVWTRTGHSSCLQIVSFTGADVAQWIQQRALWLL